MAANLSEDAKEGPRAFVEKRYSEIVDALYSNNDNVHIDTTIKYEDGRQAHIKTDLHISKVMD